MLANQLQQATVSSPFSSLGLQECDSGKGFVLRAWIPGAISIQAKDLKTNRSVGQLKQVDDSSLFELLLPRRKNRFNYYFVVTNLHHTYESIDPYQFSEQAFHAVHFLNTKPANVYNQLGAQLVSLDVASRAVEGTRFAVYAPNASSVSLIGEFNLWDGCCHPMHKTDCGHWVLFVPGIASGTKYKYEIKDPLGNRLPHKADPIGFSAEQYPSHSSVVYDHEQYQWGDDAWQKREKPDYYHSPMSIYELHLGSWRQSVQEGEPRSLTYQEMIHQLIPYVKDMGYTHIEVLPVTEHPYTGSWGYQPLGMFAVTSRYGSPDDFKAFVDACHQSGIGVIMDWVPAHFPEDSHGLARFDGTHLYEYEDPRKGWHPDWNSCIYDYGRDHVRQFLVASALYWVEKFHIDGLRVDAVASMLYLDYSRNNGEWIPNVDGGNHNYEAISLLKWVNTEVYTQFPNAITIAEESTAFPKVSAPVSDGGLGFGFKWNMGWMHDSLTYISKDPLYRKYHHNDLTFSLVYAFDENFVLPISHDEVVHGKGAMIQKMPGDDWQKAANLRAYAAFMYAHPGKKLNFMGNEIAQFKEWNHDSSVCWHLLQNDKNKGVQQLYKDLNRLYKSTPALHELDHNHEGFEWLEHHDAEHSIVAFVRKDRQGNEVYAVFNFTPTPRDNYRIGVNHAGIYSIILNSDSTYYSGSNYHAGHMMQSEKRNWHERENAITVNLPPLSALFLKKEN